MVTKPLRDEIMTSVNQTLSRKATHSFNGVRFQFIVLKTMATSLLYFTLIDRKMFCYELSQPTTESCSE